MNENFGRWLAGSCVLCNGGLRPSQMNFFSCGLNTDETRMVLTSALIPAFSSRREGEPLASFENVVSRSLKNAHQTTGKRVRLFPLLGERVRVREVKKTKFKSAPRQPWADGWNPVGILDLDYERIKSRIFSKY